MATGRTIRLARETQAVKIRRLGGRGVRVCDGESMAKARAGETEDSVSEPVGKLGPGPVASEGRRGDEERGEFLGELFSVAECEGDVISAELEADEKERAVEEEEVKEVEARRDFHTMPLDTTNAPTPTSISDMPYSSTFTNRRGKTEKSTARMAMQVAIIRPERYQPTYTSRPPTDPTPSSPFAPAILISASGSSIAKVSRVEAMVGVGGEGRTSNTRGLGPALILVLIPVVVAEPWPRGSESLTDRARHQACRTTRSDMAVIAIHALMKSRKRSGWATTKVTETNSGTITVNTSTNHPNTLPLRPRPKVRFHNTPSAKINS